MQTVTDSDVLALKKQFSVGTDIRIEQIAGKARIDSITVVEPKWFFLAAASLPTPSVHVSAHN